MNFESLAAASLKERSSVSPKAESAPGIKNLEDAESIQELIRMVALRGGSVSDSSGNEQSAEYIQKKATALRREMYKDGKMSERTLASLTRSEGLRGSVKRLIEAEYPGLNNVQRDFILDLNGDILRKEIEE